MDWFYKDGKKFKVFLLIILSAILLFGCGSESASTQNENEQLEEIKRVKTTHVEERVLGEPITIRADIHPFESVQAVAEMSGRIVSLSHKVGDALSKGQPVISLDAQDIDLQVKRADVNIERLELQLQKAITDQNLAISTLQGQINTLKNQLDVANKDLERRQELYNHRAIPLVELEAAENQVERLKLEMDILEEQLLVAQKTDAIDLLHIQIKETEITYEEANRQLQRTIIESPISGIISELPVQSGETVSAGQPVFTVEQHNSLLVKAVITEKDLPIVYENRQLTLMVPVLNKEVEAKVSYISPSASANQNGFLVEFIIDNQDRMVKPGMNAQLLLSDELAGATLIVPVGAILQDNGDKYVFVIEGNTAKKQIIVTGREMRDVVEVIDGLAIGDQIVNVGQNLLNDGDTVQVVE
ncbi:efflux RND transporter periplasmic adaptor subunit [Desulfuribacillus alkaliarsenatis]|uniref:Uncharacterized protein n=1 Tax=Desulfuribacillus alkaliarsenatis TaxID=766136 RepID=A0A1E5G2Y9_9FIRM|nr:efflux RND transporter periplasmic adaptor subunit [Desulfuribacillus alkaliarsenatis]OEF97428.1 hypothetical protein BHF68_04255 [Desulfuribacillus alkaliarsenatis]